MKIVLWILLVPAFYQLRDTISIPAIRSHYREAPLTKSASRQFALLLGKVDSSFSPVLQCYKGASLMIEAKYVLNPVIKWQKFSAGKSMIQSAISRDTLDLEMRFIRFTLQNNLPSFLGYHDELCADGSFLRQYTNECVDIELKTMINQYLTSLSATKQTEKTIKN